MKRPPFVDDFRSLAIKYFGSGAFVFLFGLAFISLDVEKFELRFIPLLSQFVAAALLTAAAGLLVLFFMAFGATSRQSFSNLPEEIERSAQARLQFDGAKTKNGAAAQTEYRAHDNVERSYIALTNKINDDNTRIGLFGLLALVLAIIFTLCALLLLAFLTTKISELMSQQEAATKITAKGAAEAGERIKDAWALLVPQVPRLLLGIFVQFVGLVFLRVYSYCQADIKVNNAVLVAANTRMHAYYLLQRYPDDEVMRRAFVDQNANPSGKGAPTEAGQKDKSDEIIAGFNKVGEQMAKLFQSGKGEK